MPVIFSRTTNNRIAFPSVFLAAWLSVILSVASASAGEFEVLRDQSGNPANVRNSPFLRMVIGDFNSLSCSHTWVSNDGYLLTALHCIEGCITGAMEFDGSRYNRFAYKKIEVPNTKYYSHPFVAFEVNESRLKDVRCLLNEGAPGKKPLEARIVALGAKGWIPDYLRGDFKKKYPEIYHEYRQKGYVGIGDHGDFALLKVEPAPPSALDTSATPNAFEYFSHPPQCLAIDGTIDTQTIGTGAQVWSLSFPNLSTRVNRSEFVYQPVATGGRVYTKNDHPHYSPEALSEIDEHFLYSSTDSEVGASGSALINSQGKIAGILAMSITDRTQYTRGASLFLPSSHILKRLRDVLGNDFVETKLLNGCSVSPSTDNLLNLLRSVSTNSRLSGEISS